VLAVVCGALFLEGIDIAMLNVAVPAIATDIGLATADAHWVISAYVLAYGGFMIFGGRTADLLGRRRTFLVALAVFVAFSGLGGLADDAWVLIVARFVTGATAGFMTPAGFSLLTTSFPEGSLRDRALAIYGAIGAGGFTLGVVAGGFLTDVGWRWVFFAPVIVGAALWFAGRAVIRPDVASELPTASWRSVRASQPLPGSCRSWPRPCSSACSCSSSAGWRTPSFASPCCVRGCCCGRVPQGCCSSGRSSRSSS
jgi:MFS family permease